VALRMPSPGYFATVRIPILAGRDFTDADTFGAPSVIILSQRTAERFWPGENPIGKRVTLKMMSPEPRRVVGVVGEVKMNGLDAGAADSETAIYAPAAQIAYSGALLVVRTAVAPEALAQPVVAAVHRIDPEQPVLEVQTLQQVLDDSLGQRPVAMWLLASFAALALALASIGIYSVLAYTVRQRVREIGIRMALGAPSSGVVRMVVLDGLKPTLAGVILGLALAAALVRVMDTLLFGISAHDPGIFSLVAALVAGVGLVATLLPAWRATHVDPIVTLRAE
jgi:putative ABC transport system permease protein